MRRAVVVSVATGLTVACIGTISYIISGMFAQGLPAWSLGYVYLPAWFAVAVGGMLFAPLGVKLSHRLPVELLKRLFAVFLFVVGFHMIMWGS